MASLATAVEFAVDAPVACDGIPASPDLDALVARWRADPAVSAVAVEWRAWPRPGEPPVGAATVRVELVAGTRQALRRAYDRLTRQVAGTPALRLSGRTCSLTDMLP